MPIPEVSLAGRIPPHNGTILLDTNALHLSESYTNWVNFHNGVAAGLRISSNSKHGVDDGLTRTWIIYNKPKGNQRMSTLVFDGAGASRAFDEVETY